MIDLNYLINHILYQIFNTIFSISQKKISTKLKTITFKTKTEYYLEPLTPETMK